MCLLPAVAAGVVLKSELCCVYSVHKMAFSSAGLPWVRLATASFFAIKQPVGVYGR